MSTLICLPFHDAEGGIGELIIDAQTLTFQFVPTTESKVRLQAAITHADTQALKIGVTALSGLTAAGTAMVIRGKRSGGYAALAAAGLIGVGGYFLRRALKQVPDTLLKPLPLSWVSLGWNDADGLKLKIDGGSPTRRFVVELAAGEFEPGEADTFLRGLAIAQRT